MKQFKSYLANGLLKEQFPDFAQIKKQLQRAGRDLETARHLLVQDPQWAATIAYQSMLRAGRALLFAHGVLPADGRQHKTVVEITGKILGVEYEVLVQQFERLRRKRNVFFYDSEESITGTETRRRR
jgi:uncharacterized protein (UPF0332 family)